MNIIHASWKTIGVSIWRHGNGQAAQAAWIVKLRSWHNSSWTVVAYVSMEVVTGHQNIPGAWENWHGHEWQYPVCEASVVRNLNRINRSQLRHAYSKLFWVPQLPAVHVFSLHFVASQVVETLWSWSSLVRRWQLWSRSELDVKTLEDCEVIWHELRWTQTSQWTLACIYRTSVDGLVSLYFQAAPARGLWELPIA